MAYLAHSANGTLVQILLVRADDEPQGKEVATHRTTLLLFPFYRWIARASENEMCDLEAEICPNEIYNVWNTSHVWLAAPFDSTWDINVEPLPRWILILTMWLFRYIGYITDVLLFLQNDLNF